VAQPLGSIDKVVVIEQGGSNGQSGVTKFASTTPTLIFNLLQQLEALGINIPNLASQLGGVAAPSVGQSVTETVTKTVAEVKSRTAAKE